MSLFSCKYTDFFDYVEEEKVCLVYNIHKQRPDDDFHNKLCYWTVRSRHGALHSDSYLLRLLNRVSDSDTFYKNKKDKLEIKELSINEQKEVSIKDFNRYLLLLSHGSVIFSLEDHTFRTSICGVHEFFKNESIRGLLDEVFEFYLKNSDRLPLPW